jgi:hypothetical protein
VSSFKQEGSALCNDVAKIVRLAGRVVQDHVQSCQATALIAPSRSIAAKRYGAANAWRYYADPDIVALAQALVEMSEH